MVSKSISKATDVLNEFDSDEEDEKNRVSFKPSLEECEEFVLSSMNMIIQSTNIVNNLESDLMPFLQKQ